MTDPILYARVNGPPENWNLCLVRNLVTGDLIDDVVEVNAKEGWLRRYKQVNGQPVIRNGELVIEHIRGKFAIEVRP